MFFLGFVDLQDWVQVKKSGCSNRAFERCNLNAKRVRKRTWSRMAWYAARPPEAAMSIRRAYLRARCEGLARGCSCAHRSLRHPPAPSSCTGAPPYSGSVNVYASRRADSSSSSPSGKYSPARPRARACAHRAKRRHRSRHREQRNRRTKENTRVVWRTVDAIVRYRGTTRNTRSRVKEYSTQEIRRL
eukprot:1193384-Prorocentrum_minimum.AAC.2